MTGKLPGHYHSGPYNDVNSQLNYDQKTGEILEIYDQPTAETDLIAMQQDVDYSISKDDRKCKNIADRKMVKALDNVPYNVLWANAQKNWAKSANRGHSSKPNLPSFSVCNKVLMSL